MYFHYTNIEALFNIIISKRVWFSSLAFMNDEKEGYELHRVLTDVLKLKHGTDQCVKVLSLVDQFIINYLRLQLAFSASTLKDDISQWRAYTNIGQGICIEFVDGFISKSEVKKIKCLYGYNEKKQAIIDDQNLKVNDETFDMLLQDFNGIQEYMGSLVETLVRFKSPSFAPEKEVRWVYTADILTPDSTYKFRPHRLGLTTYIDIPVDLGKIKSITIGPQVPRQNIKTIEDFALQNNCKCRVIQSKVSLR